MEGAEREQRKLLLALADSIGAVYREGRWLVPFYSPDGTYQLVDVECCTRRRVIAGHRIFLLEILLEKFVKAAEGFLGIVVPMRAGVEGIEAFCNLISIRNACKDVLPRPQAAAPPKTNGAKPTPSQPPPPTIESLFGNGIATIHPASPPLNGAKPAPAAPCPHCGKVHD